MRRRDTILVAILINAGLLVILFATAVTRHEEGRGERVLPREEQRIVVEQEHQPPRLQQPSYPIRDEVDALLSDWAREEAEVTTAKIDPLPSPPHEEMKSVEVVVKRGDSLDRIARANCTSVEAIVRANRLRTTTLQVGQKLTIPLQKEEVQKAAQYKSGEGIEEDLYTIRSGDNPWLIAMKFHLPLEELLELNNLDEESARRLKPGDQIRIR